MHNPPPHSMQQQYPQPPPHNVAAGTFDMGGGHQLRVKINGQSPGDYVKNKIIGYVIGAVLTFVMVAGFIVAILYFMNKQASEASAQASGAPREAKAAAWDGKSTFECKANDAVTLSGITANVSGTAIKASGNCQLTLVNVNLTAPVAIDAGGAAKITMTGGSITATTNAVVAAGAAKVDLVGTKVAGKSKKSGAANITGAP